MSRATAIGGNETAGGLTERLAVLGAEVLAETCDAIARGPGLREVVAGGYIQLGDKRSEAGGCSGGGCGGCGTVPAEFKRKHVRGAVGVGLALNQKKPTTACEFYFCLADLPKLDEAGYTVIGRVIDGMAILDKVGKVKVDNDRKPTTPIVISKVTAEYVKPQE
jgi:cyclophilin family peptidyl-prolyl cis-trans isomerase